MFYLPHITAKTDCVCSVSCSLSPLAGIVESDDITALVREMEKAADYWEKVRRIISVLLNSLELVRYIYIYKT